MNEIKIDVINTAIDYRRILFWYYRQYLVSSVLLTVLSIISAFWLLDFGESNSWFESRYSASFIIFVLLLMMPLLLACLTCLEIWRKAKRNEKIKESAKVIFTEQGLAIIAKFTSSQSNWNEFKKVIETNEDFIFIPQETAFFSVPKRFFKSDLQIEELRNLVRRHLDDKSKLKS